MAAQEPEPAAPAMYHLWPSILGHLEKSPVVVVSAAPGAGKSSVLPRYLAHHGYGPVICAQPRHFAVTVAAAKARNQDVLVPPLRRESALPEPAVAGEEEEERRRRRDVTFTTTRELLDMFGALDGFGAVVVDEVHERTICTDVLLGMIKAAVVAKSMPRCKFVICTACGGETEGMLLTFFAGAPLVSVPGAPAPHHVEVLHLIPMPDAADVVRTVVGEVVAIDERHPPGDVLAFLPSVAAIEEAIAELREVDMPGLVTRYVHDHLPTELMGTMLSAAAPDGCRRRVVLATDVAETAVLVGGITYVVDPGVASNSDEPLERISKEAAARRAAAAGYGAWPGPGRCHRLYYSCEHAGLDEHTVPHIRRHGGVAKFLLVMKRHAAAGGSRGLEVFDPSVTGAELADAAGELIAAGHFDGHGNPTAKGLREAYDED